MSKRVRALDLICQRRLEMNDAEWSAYSSVMLGSLTATDPAAVLVAVDYADRVIPHLCHCGRPVSYGFDGNPHNHRGMCDECDARRCDAYPLECPYRGELKP